MNKIITKIFLGCFLFCCSSVFGRDGARPVSTSGYVSGMPSMIVQQPDTETWWQLLVHNRLNFGWQMTNHFRVDAGMRNRLITGSEMMINPKSISADAGWLDLSWNWVNVETWHAASLLGNTAFDRLNITFEKRQMETSIRSSTHQLGTNFRLEPQRHFQYLFLFRFRLP